MTVVRLLGFGASERGRTSPPDVSVSIQPFTLIYCRRAAPAPREKNVYSALSRLTILDSDELESESHENTATVPNTPPLRHSSASRSWSQHFVITQHPFEFPSMRPSHLLQLVGKLARAGGSAFGPRGNGRDVRGNRRGVGAEPGSVTVPFGLWTCPHD